MSAYTETEATLTLEDGVERDYSVRATVEHHKGPGHYGYRVDGDVEVLVADEWTTLDSGTPAHEAACDALYDAAESEDSARFCA